MENTVAEVYATRLLSPLPILAVALAIVITGVLAFRLHAFLTLIVAALAVAALAPVASIERYELTREGVRIDRVDPDGRTLHVTARAGQLTPAVTYDVYHLTRGASTHLPTSKHRCGWAWHARLGRIPSQAAATICRP